MSIEYKCRNPLGELVRLWVAAFSSENGIERELLLRLMAYHYVNQKTPIFGAFSRRKRPQLNREPPYKVNQPSMHEKVGSNNSN